MHQTSVRPLMHEAVSRQLGTEIIEGEWAEGMTMTLDDVQSRFGISRTVAREVSRRLEAMGLVTSRRRIGLAAQPISRWNVLDPLLITWRLRSDQRDAQISSLTQLRIAVEPAAAECTARIASAEQRAGLIPIAALMRRTGESGELDEYLDHDIAFHRFVLESSGNELFAALGDLVATVLRGRTEAGLMPPHPKPESIVAHEKVARAVQDGQGDQAREAMLTILDEVRETFDVDGQP